MRPTTCIMLLDDNNQHISITYDKSLGQKINSLKLQNKISYYNFLSDYLIFFDPYEKSQKQNPFFHMHNGNLFAIHRKRQMNDTDIDLFTKLMSKLRIKGKERFVNPPIKQIFKSPINFNKALKIN